MLSSGGPWFQGERLEAFGAYWAVFEANYEAILSAIHQEALEIAPSLSRPENAERAR